MTSLFLDTDILLDFLGDRKPFSAFAVRIFAGAHQGLFKLHTSGNGITTAYYILGRQMEERKTRKLIADLLDYVQVIPVSEKILRQAFIADFTDFENAVQHQCALTIGKIKYIVTRNLRKYKNSQIPVVSPEQLFSRRL